jgi:hypothetical protein
MFPQGISTALRMYFFHAPNGRMLVIAGLRRNENSVTERRKGGIVVRELKRDHSLGEVFTLRPHGNAGPNQPTLFTASSEKAFVEACQQLLSNHTFLQTQDYGVLLDQAQRMKWNDPESWGGDEELKKKAMDFGKAFCFFRRKDGALVGLAKKRWVTVSRDGGNTWSQPVQPASLVTNMGKVWGQETSDGRYVLIYNPDMERRWPLVMLTSNDGITFRDPYALHDALPAQRYKGKAKDLGASYHRGLSKWTNDGSWKDKALWLVYSLNKEEIRVIRVPLFGVPTRSR